MLGLKFFQRTNGRRSVNLASFHSPHSLTWSWILSATVEPVMWPKPYAMRNSVGFGAGLGQLVGFHTYTSNGGRQFALSLLWICLRWQRQQPMFYRDMMRRAWAARDAVENEASRLRGEMYRPAPNAISADRSWMH